MSPSATALLSGAAGSILRLPRPAKRLIMMCADAIMLPIAFWFALMLQYDGVVALSAYRELLLGAAACGVACFSLLGLYRAVVRFMGANAISRAVLGVTLSVLGLAVCAPLGLVRAVPASTLAIYWALCLLYAAASRLAVRYACYHTSGAPAAKRVAIYGAGEAGARLCAALTEGGHFKPVLFVDDRAALQGSQINGICVHPPQDLSKLVMARKVDRVLLAMPSVSRRRRREVLSALEPLGVHVQSLPDLADIVAGKARIEELREVDLGDLLGRDPVPPDPALFESCIRGKSVMVTGAGGSIGSELCRQILRVGPRRLVLYEMSELALYNAQRELQEIAAREQPGAEIVALLDNAARRERVREIMTAYAVQTVYHAAAYKHVPIVEHNVVRGIHNNVICTWNVAEAALGATVETFVLVSTDKAVNPSSVMGATKRLAELVLQGLQTRSKTTRFCMVRFGNVLGSSGSVVPLFREQICRGGPVTVTHPQIIRYFMTIQEAAQLVIQAGSMARGGDVFVLDMGQPVRIDDLARRMINLMGLTVLDGAHPDGDIEIVYTGLRSAEKLFEELLIGSNVTATEHPMIMRAIEHSIPWLQLKRLLEKLSLALERVDYRQALFLLRQAVSEYRPSAPGRDEVRTRQQPAASCGHDTVADLSALRRQADHPGRSAAATAGHPLASLANSPAAR